MAQKILVFVLKIYWILLSKTHRQFTAKRKEFIPKNLSPIHLLSGSSVPPLDSFLLLFPKFPCAHTSKHKVSCPSAFTQLIASCTHCSVSSRCFHTSSQRTFTLFLKLSCITLHRYARIYLTRPTLLCILLTSKPLLLQIMPT